MENIGKAQLYALQTL